MSGLDDLLGSLTKSTGGQSGQGGQGGLGLDDLLGGLLGGGSGSSGASAGAGGLQDILGGLLGGGGGSVGTRSGGGIDMGALVATLGPLVAKFLQGGGLSKIMQGAQANGLSAQADSWVGTGANEPLEPSQVRAVVGEDAVQQVAREAGISEDEAADVLAAVVPQMVNGLTPNGQVPSDQEVDDFLAQFSKPG
ncbi:MAG TPA: YidB family protein [Gaiella sp.]|nr:YidB family protein [Gaiella sp.]